METKRNVDTTKEKIERRENLNKESFRFFFLLSYFYSFLRSLSIICLRHERIVIFFVDGWDSFSRNDFPTPYKVRVSQVYIFVVHISLFYMHVFDVEDKLLAKNK